MYKIKYSYNIDVKFIDVQQVLFETFLFKINSKV